MAVMDRWSGRSLVDDEADIRQSVADILMTPIGTRVMRRTYGSHLGDLVDAPGNAVGALRVIAATADAIDRWEERVRVQGASVAPGADGQAILRIDMRRVGTGRKLSVDIPLGLIR